MRALIIRSRIANIFSTRARYVPCISTPSLCRQVHSCRHFHVRPTARMKRWCHPDRPGLSDPPPHPRHATVRKFGRTPCDLASPSTCPALIPSSTSRTSRKPERLGFSAGLDRRGVQYTDAVTPATWMLANTARKLHRGRHRDHANSPRAAGNGGDDSDDAYSTSSGGRFLCGLGVSGPGDRGLAWHAILANR